MTTEAMREVLRNAPKYRRALKWVMRVDAMHPNQVLAVYTRMLWAGELQVPTIRIVHNIPTSKN